MVDAPCSRIGHIYRKFAPFPNPGVGDFVGRVGCAAYFCHENIACNISHWIVNENDYSLLINHETRN